MNMVIDKIRRNIVPFFIAVVLLTGVCCAWYFLHPASPYHKRYTFVVAFDKVGTLVPGNRVSVRGISCGEVLKVQLTEDAVYVRARVLATTRIPRNSQFRLITAGLMGERELSVLSGDSREYVAEGDTVKGLYEEGTAGITKSLKQILHDIRDIEAELKNADTIVVQPVGEQVGRVVDKGRKLLSTTNKNIRNWKNKLSKALRDCDTLLYDVKAELEDVSAKGGESAEKVMQVMPRVEALLEKTKSLRTLVDEVAAKMEGDDNTVGLVLKSDGKLAQELDQTVKDIDALMEDLKKQGLKLNVDIF